MEGTSSLNILKKLRKYKIFTEQTVDIGVTGFFGYW